MEAVATAVDARPRPVATRVLLVSSRASGGLARHVSALLAALPAPEYELAVACDPEGLIADTARALSLPVYGVSFQQTARTTRAMLAAWHLSAVISGFRANLVHTHSYQAGLVGAVSVPLSRPARLIATIHGFPPAPQEGEAPNAGARMAVRMIVGRAARVIAVSEALRTEILGLRPEAAEKLVMIPNGVDVRTEPKLTVNEARATFGLQPDIPLVGLVARLAPRKGIAEFLHAAQLIADRAPEAHFVLVGDGPLRTEAEALVAELGLAGRMHLLGYLDSVRNLLWALDVLAVSSLSEGSSISAMEAMALGKPVVGTAVGGVPEVIVDGDTGLLVPPGDPQALAEAVCALLADPGRARSMGERGRQRAAAHFDIEMMLQRTKEVYADVLRETMEGGKPRR